jgi:hypothetical protein
LANHNRTASSFESAGGFCGAEERAMMYGGIPSHSTRTTSRYQGPQRHGYSAGSPCDLPTSTQPPTALGPVPLTALAFIEG